jgi:CRISPR-associated protein Cas6/Cse3/CasE subtype I-E
MILYVREQMFTQDSDSNDAYKHHLNAKKHLQETDAQFSVCSPLVPKMTIYMVRETSPIMKDEFDTSIDMRKGNELEFYLRANPCFHSTQNIANGKKIDRIKAITGEEDLIDWLSHKLKDHGAKPINIDVLTIKALPCQLGHIVLNEVWFKGRISVNEPIDFRTLFSNGIGKKKSFGFGMIIPEKTSHFNIINNIHNKSLLH